MPSKSTQSAALFLFEQRNRERRSDFRQSAIGVSIIRRWIGDRSCHCLHRSGHAGNRHAHCGLGHAVFRLRLRERHCGPRQALLVPYRRRRCLFSRTSRFGNRLDDDFRLGSDAIWNVANLDD